MCIDLDYNPSAHSTAPTPEAGTRRNSRLTQGEGSTATSVNPAEELWQCQDPPEGYPKGVIRVPAPIAGTAFFPGGHGLWRPDVLKPLPEFPLGGIMVLGHD